MKVFLSYAVRPADTTIAVRLRAVAAAYDIAILLPDRTLTANDAQSDTHRKIRESDAVIILVTSGAQWSSIGVVNQELATAHQEEKPIVMLVDECVPVQGMPENQIVRFNPFMPHQHERKLEVVIQQIQQQRNEDLTALGWIARIALGLVVLGELLGDKK